MSNNSPKLHLTKFFSADEKKLFAALTDSSSVEKWFHPEGMQSNVSEWDARKDGNLNISLSDNEETYIFTGTFIEVIPLRKIVFTYGWDDGAKTETTVTIELRNLDDGTDVSLTQEGIDVEEIEDLKDGWLSAFENLADLFN